MKRIIFILLVLIPFSASATTFTITIPDDKVSAVVNAFATQYRYQVNIDDGEGGTIPNPVSKAQFAKNIIRSFVREVYVGAQIKAIEATRLQIIEDANTATDGISVE